MGPLASTSATAGSRIRRPCEPSSPAWPRATASGATLGPAVIFYVAESKGPPKVAFGIATRPDELMHLIADALERRRS